MSLHVDVLNTLSVDVVSQVVLEQSLVLLLIVIQQLLHVLSNVTTEDVLSQQLSVQLLRLNVPTWESLSGVRNVQTTVRSTLQDTEDSSTGGGSLQTNVQVDLEWSWGILNSLNQLVLTLNFLDTLVGLVQAQLLQGSSGNQQTGSVSSGPVGQTVVNTVSWQLVRVSSGEDNVTNDLRRNDLSNDVSVGDSNNQSVLWRVVLGLVLGDQALSLVVVGLTLLSSTERGLETGVVGGSLLGLESHFVDVQKNFFER